MSRVTAITLSLLMTLAACGGGGGSSPASYALGGSVTGLTMNSQLVLANGTDKVTVTAAGTFTFPKTLTSGSTYAVTVESQPTGQSCSVTSGSGTIGSAAVTSVQVNCITVFATGGTVSGMTAGSSLTLKRGTETLVVNANGTFSFTTGLASGATYSVGVQSAPSGQKCVISNGAGTVASKTINDIQVLCETPASSAAFLTSPRSLPDLEPLYAQLCVAPANGRSLQHVIPVDLNKDGLTDFIVNIWCSPVAVSGTDFLGPTPNRVVALVQDAQGNFTDKTAEVFGTSTVDIGGVGEYYVTGDFNGDGYTDILFSVQREDGRRINNPPTTQYARNYALMSQGGGRYTAEPFGTAAWGAGFVMMDNAAGGKDVIAMSFSDSPRAWTYKNGWTSSGVYDWLGGSGSLFFSRSTPNAASTQAINATQGGVELYTYSSGTWSRNGEFSYPLSTIQKLCCGNAQPSGAAFVQIDGKDYIDPSFGFSCEIRRTPSSAAEALVVFDANEIVGGYTGQVVVYGQTPLQELFKIFSFSVGSDGKLQRNNLVIRNELQRDVYANRMACLDLNGDGYDDIILYSTNFNGQKDPIVYLNDGTGAFDRVDPKVFPASPTEWSLRNYVIADADNDGVRDLIYFQIVGYAGKENRVTVHKGLRPFRASDVMK
ncbi:MAG: hypothetical protein RI949_1659 [Pseudomonadota bacterium]